MKKPKQHFYRPYFNPEKASAKVLDDAGDKANVENLESSIQYLHRHVSVSTPFLDLAMALVNEEDGAEWYVLAHVAEAAVLGRSISAELQKIANFLLAKALHEGKLPNREPGRPSEESYALTSVERAYRYYELLDAGTKGPAVVAGEQLHVSARKVELAAQKYRWLIGLFPEDREKFRTRRAKLLIRPHEVSSGGIFNPRILEVAHHSLG